MIGSFDCAEGELWEGVRKSLVMPRWGQEPSEGLLRGFMWVSAIDQSNNLAILLLLQRGIALHMRISFPDANWQPLEPYQWFVTLINSKWQIH